MRNKGAALIMVLVAVAIMIMTASVISIRFNKVFFTTQNTFFYDRARWYVDGIEGIIIKYMRDDFKKTPSKVYLGMNWAQEDQIIPLDEAVISGSVTDEMACFNINALNKNVVIEGATVSESQNEDGMFKTDTFPALVFKQLLKTMGADDTLAETITDSASDWIDTNSNVKSAYGAEDPYYMSKHVPYVTTGGYFFDKSELRMVKGMTAELYRRIEPMICALPNDKFNISINTLKRRQAPLLNALFLDHLDIETAVNVIEKRPEYGWDSPLGFFRMEGLNAAAAEMNGLKKRINQSVVVNSNYFVANIKVTFDDEEYAFKTRFYREADTKLVVYQRLIGELHE